MEDLNDNLPTAGKRYYMSHSEYFFSEKRLKEYNIPERNVPFKSQMLVCASNQENARKAVLNVLEENGDYIVTKCRIDYLIVGE